MTTIDQTEPRTYGGWRNPKGFGLGVLGTLGTVLLFGTLLGAFLMLLATSSIVAALLAGLIGVGAVGLVSVPDTVGRTVGQRVAARAGHWRARASGSASYRSGPIAPRVGTFRLPGLAAQSTVSEAVDAQGRPFAIVHVPATGHYTVALVGEPDGRSLVDQGQVDQWVSHYGQWLAALGREPQLVAASVTIETAPDTGSRLRREVEGNLDPDAPEVALSTLREIVDAYPAGAATVRAFVALTFSSRVRRRSGAPRKAAEIARDLSNRMPYLTAALQAAGAGAVRPVSAAGLCEFVRVAFDPAAASAFDAARAVDDQPAADWANAGPVAAEAGWDYYRHDSGVSVTWTMVGAPRGAVTSRVLEPLLRPHQDIDRQRLTLVYGPVDAATAARLVEKDRDHASSRVRATRKPGARAVADHEHAEQAAMEEAQGAGLVNVGLLVCATVTDPHRLDAARLAVEQLAPASRLTLRPVYGSQDSAFAATLPIGVVLDRHVRVPTSLRGPL